MATQKKCATCLVSDGSFNNLTLAGTTLTGKTTFPANATFQFGSAAGTIATTIFAKRQIQYNLGNSEVVSIASKKVNLGGSSHVNSITIGNSTSPTVTIDGQLTVTGNMTGNASTASAAQSGSSLEIFINASKKAFKSAAIYYTGAAGIHTTANSHKAAGDAYVAAGDAHAAAVETAKAADIYTLAGVAYTTAGETAKAAEAYKSAGNSMTELANIAKALAVGAGNNFPLATAKYTEAANHYTTAGNYYRAAGETVLASAATASSNAAYKSASEVAIVVANAAKAEADNAGNNYTLAITKYKEAANNYTTAAKYYTDAGETGLATSANALATSAIALAVAATAAASAGLVAGNVSADMTTTGMTTLRFRFTNNDDGFAYLPFTKMDFYFFGVNYGNSDGTTPTKSIYMNSNYAFGFGKGSNNWTPWNVTQPAILFDYFDSYNFASYVSSPQNGTKQSVKYVRIVATGSDYISINSLNDKTTIKKAYEIYFVRDISFQYILFNCSVEDAARFNRSGYAANISNITNGTAFQNTFGSFGLKPPNTGGPQAGNSYVIRSDLNGNNWQFLPNTHLIL